jgi:hypothetical protein
LSEIKYHLNPYGIWYYGETLSKLTEKTGNAIRLLLYFPPDIRNELETLIELKLVEGFEDIGKEIEDWKHRIERQYLDWNSCKNLYEASVHWKNIFIQRVNDLLLIRPKLHILSVDKVKKFIEDLPEDDKVKEWLQEEDCRVTEFREGSKALLFGLPTAAGFYFVRLCERALRELYKKETGKDVERKTWGAILDELEVYYKNKQRPNVLDLISYLKSSRDRIAHPEQFLTQKEAEELYTFTLRALRELKESELIK